MKTDLCKLLSIAVVLLCGTTRTVAAPAAAPEKVALPDGTFFPFWDDQTVYRKTYHVDGRNSQARDDNPGTAQKPFKTMGRAAQIVEPGEKVIVHEGVYRECVSPPRGGNGPESMIAYEAAEGEHVVVSGAVEWKPRCRPSSGWERPQGAKTLWMADLPSEAFVGYNPFLARNIHEEFVNYRNLDDAPKYLLRRGMVFVDGRPLKQVFRFSELAGQDGAFWVEEPGLRIHFRLPGDADPEKAAFEVTAREQVFAPQQRGLGYIRVSGFCFERAADGVPVPQRAMVSTSRGHHWIIENNRLRWANACGMDVGNQDWKASPPPQFGRHIIRGNHVSDCGVCGIAGCSAVDETLVEDNLVERVGGLDIERMWEVAGLKFHTAKGVLIRRNTFRDLPSRRRRLARLPERQLPGHGQRLLQHLVRQRGIVPGSQPRGQPAGPQLLLGHTAVGRKPRIAKDGSAVCADSSDFTVVAYNFFGKIPGFAVSMNNLAGRPHRGRTQGRVPREPSAQQRLLRLSAADLPRPQRQQRCATATCTTPAIKGGLFDIQKPAPQSQAAPGHLAERFSARTSDRWRRR